MGRERSLRGGTGTEITLRGGERLAELLFLPFRCVPEWSLPVSRGLGRVSQSAAIRGLGVDLGVGVDAFCPLGSGGFVPDPVLRARPASGLS